MPDFNDFEYRLPVVEAVITVRVKADLLHLFWGAGVGPQDEAGIVEANRSSLDALANGKLKAGESADGLVIVDAADWEAEDDGTPFEGDDGAPIYD